MKILKIQQRKKIWINVTSQEYEIKILELKKGKPNLQLIYNNDITFRIIYECDLCKNQIETSWKKFVEHQIKKNKCLCQKCTMKSKDIRKKISEKTKNAMDNEELRKHMSNKQNERWQKPEEIEKRKNISKEIMQRPGMKEYVSIRTKEEMNKFDLKQLCNPYKHMSENEIKKYHEKIGKKISNEYNEDTYDKYLNSYNITMNTNKESQIKMINHIKDMVKSKQTNLQRYVTNYIVNILGINMEEEYDINLFGKGYDYKFMLLDLSIPNKKICIEINGNYYHDAFNEYLNGVSKKEIYNKYNNDNFQLERFKKDLFKQKYLIDNNWQILYLSENQILYTNWINIILKFFKEAGVIDETFKN